MEVIRRDDLSLVRFVNTIYASNTYLLHADRCSDAWLVDCGDPEPVLKFLSSTHLVLRGVLLTHVHYDHIYGLNVLKCNIPELRVYTSEAGLENLHEPKSNFSKYHGADFRYEADDVRTVHDNSPIELFPGRVIRCRETPGHDWSCLTFCIGKFLFSGDAFIPGLKTVTTFPKSDRKQAISSLMIIQQLITPQMLICPGHGPLAENVMF